VNRGICEVDGQGLLRRIREVLEIERDDRDARYPGPSGDPVGVAGETPVSLNFWGFGPAIVPALETSFDSFLAEHGDSTTAELFLPEIVQDLIDRGEARVHLLSGGGPWAGLTYPEDRPHLVTVLEERTASGAYPRDLWP